MANQGNKLNFICNRVIKIIKEDVGIETFDDKRITLDTVLEADTTCDSLDYTYFIMECEKEFGIRIPDEMAFKFRSLPIRNIIEYIIEQTKGAAEKSGQPEAKPIEVVQKNNKAIEFHQNGEIVNLDNPQILPLIDEMKAKLNGKTR